MLFPVGVFIFLIGVLILIVASGTGFLKMISAETMIIMIPSGVLITLLGGYIIYKSKDISEEK